MLLSSYELKIIEDWRKHFGAELTSDMLRDLRAELPVDRFGFVQQSQRIGNRVVLVELPKWAKDARVGIVSIRKEVSVA